LGILIGATLVAVLGIADDPRVAPSIRSNVVACPRPRRFCWLAEFAAGFSVLVGGRSGDFLDAVLTVVGWWGLQPRSASSITWTAGAGVAAMHPFLRHVAYLNGQTLVTTLAAAVLGAAPGFSAGLQPAKIFMGDGGAMF